MLALAFPRVSRPVKPDVRLDTVTGSTGDDPTPGAPAATGPVDYGGFVRQVAAAQLAAWLPESSGRILDLSAGCPALTELMLASGHEVLRAGPVRARPSGRLHPVEADTQELSWLAPERLDAVVAEGSALSTALATEVTLDDLHRILRPGGRLLLAVDSLLSGLSQLARQGRWAELADVPSADVVLIPRDDGRVTRCFWPEELDGILTAAGFAVEWVRPRTVMTEDAVTQALAIDPAQLPMLVRTELRLAEEHQGESVGAQLVASAVRS